MSYMALSFACMLYATYIKRNKKIFNQINEGKRVCIETALCHTKKIYKCIELNDSKL